MKKILFLFLFLFTVSSTYAVKYRSVGSSAEFTAYLFDGQYYLILTFSEGSGFHMTEETIVKMQTKDGKVIKIGSVKGSSSERSSSNFWGIDYDQVSTKTEKKRYAMLAITREQIEMLKAGVHAVAINTIPEVYYRDSWSGKDKFGPGLYDDFMIMKDPF